MAFKAGKGASYCPVCAAFEKIENLTEEEVNNLILYLEKKPLPEGVTLMPEESVADTWRVIFTVAVSLDRVFGPEAGKIDTEHLQKTINKWIDLFPKHEKCSGCGILAGQGHEVTSLQRVPGHKGAYCSSCVDRRSRQQKRRVVAEREGKTVTVSSTGEMTISEENTPDSRDFPTAKYHKLLGRSFPELHDKDGNLPD